MRILLGLRNAQYAKVVVRLIFKNPYWTNKSKIQMLERWILVHSLLYYEFNTSIISDEMYDKNSKQLAEMIKKYPNSFKQTKYYYCFKGFDGSTGFDLYDKLTQYDKDIVFMNAETLLRR